MTYCLGIRTKDGLIAVADGRVTSGSQMATARKLTFAGGDPHRFCIMTSGLRSVRDKTIAYLRQDHDLHSPDSFPSLLDAVNAFTSCLRRVAKEDGEALLAGDLTFNLHAIIGGQLREDPEPSMFLIYPEGNWIQIDRRTPYLTIGSTSYGKPILDRALSFNTEMRHALKLAYLAFDSTRFSSTDVGYPLDMATFATETRTWRESQFQQDDLIDQRRWWNEHIKELAESMPDGPWVDRLIQSATDKVSPIRDPRR